MKLGSPPPPNHTPLSYLSIRIAQALLTACRQLGFFTSPDLGACVPSACMSMCVCHQVRAAQNAMRLHTQ